MKVKHIARAILFAAIALCTSAMAAGAPKFEVEASRPKMPEKWKFGDVSSIAIDAQDNVRVLHRPRTLQGDQAKMAAPAIMIFDSAGNYLRSWGGTAGNDKGFEWPQRENRRVQMFTSAGKFLKQYVRHNAPFARNVALSADAEQRYLYVGGGIDIVILDRKTLEFVDVIGGGGLLGGGHQIATDSKGNIYVAQTVRGLQKLVYKGMGPVTNK